MQYKRVHSIFYGQKLLCYSQAIGDYFPIVRVYKNIKTKITLA